MATVGAIYAEIRATTTGLRRDMADAVTITKQGTTAMSQVLDEFGKPVFSGITDSAKRLKGPILDVDSSLRGLAKTSRGLVGPLTSELGPAFDGIGIRIAHVLTTSASLSSGMGALAIAAAGLAGVLGGALANAWKKNAEEAATFQAALNSLDAGKLNAELDKSLKKLDDLGKTMRGLQGFEFPGEAPTGINPRTGEPRLPLGGQTATGAAKAARDAELEKGRRRREAEDVRKTAESEIAGMATLQPMIDKIATDSQKAEEDRLQKLQDVRFAAARKVGEETLAEVERTNKESEKANQAHDDVLAKIENERVQRAFANGRAVNDEEERLNRESLAADMRDLDKQQALIDEGLKSQLAAIDEEQEAAIKAGKMMMDMDEAQAAARQRASDAFVASFEIGNLIIANALDSLLQRTHTVGEAFAQMGRAIASALIQNVVNEGLKKVEEALFRFLENLQKTGLLETLAQLIGVGGTAALGATAGGGAQTVSAGVFSTGAGLLELQHGGIVRNPTVAMIGEGGPEAVIPLDRLGGGVVVNVINQAPNTEVDQSQKRGPNGQVIHDMVIREVRRSLRGGELDRDFSDVYSLRRAPVGR